MDELLEIVDRNGASTGKFAMKSEAHREGLFHLTIHVWFYTKEGQILIQQRAKDKDTFPLLWDVSVAGHIGAGEDIMLSALREVQEEIGLQIEVKDLKKIGIFKSVHKHSPQLIDCEFHHTFLCELKEELSKLTKQESEVENLALISIEALSEDLKDPVEHKKYVPHQKEYYQTIINEIECVL